jgi:hypothetical protein
MFDSSLGNTMTYQVFKKSFFPQMCHAQADDRDGDDLDSQHEGARNHIFDQATNHRDEQPRKVKQRMLEIERKLRIKLSNNYDSVRKAFLAMDSDHDGFITIEDFMRLFGG